MKNKTIVYSWLGLIAFAFICGVFTALAGSNELNPLLEVGLSLGGFGITVFAMVRLFKLPDLK